MKTYDRQGNSITTDEWAKLIEDLAYKRVAYTELETCRVSTVWLGLDHGWDKGVPIIFETMVFGGINDDDQFRYSTEAEALEGHAKVVEQNRVVILSEVHDRGVIEQ